MIPFPSFPLAYLCIHMRTCSVVALHSLLHHSSFFPCLYHHTMPPFSIPCRSTNGPRSAISCLLHLPPLVPCTA
ncbi:hypothetical protein C8R45DRAFT_1046928 [Mycena sanguinolenta]|nr:hypothetical protein C8R45DRAFT_1046928 [Mycena sanguinolenta]